MYSGPISCVHYASRGVCAVSGLAGPAYTETRPWGRAQSVRCSQHLARWSEGVGLLMDPACKPSDTKHDLYSDGTATALLLVTQPQCVPATRQWLVLRWLSLHPGQVIHLTHVSR